MILNRVFWKNVSGKIVSFEGTAVFVIRLIEINKGKAFGPLEDSNL